MEPARKYQHVAVEQLASNALMSLARTEPVRACALGCLYDMEHVAREAALYSLRHSPKALVAKGSAELDLASAQDLRRLLDYRHKCTTVVSNYVTDWRNPGCGIAIPDWNTCTSQLWGHDGQGNELYVPPWWSGFMTQLAGTLQECTWEGAIRDRDMTDSALVRRPCGKACSHPDLYIAAYATLTTLRTNVASKIGQVGATLYISEFALSLQFADHP